MSHPTHQCQRRVLTSQESSPLQTILMTLWVWKRRSQEHLPEEQGGQGKAGLREHRGEGSREAGDGGDETADEEEKEDFNAQVRIDYMGSKGEIQERRNPARS